MISLEKEEKCSSYVGPKIKVLGVGGAGGNALEVIYTKGLGHIECIALNTDVQALERSKADKHIQLGKNISRGMGTGANPEVGRQAAEEDLQEILEVTKDADIVFLIGGLGGGTASGSLPVISKLLQEQNILCVSLVTKPFSFEGSRRMHVAQQSLEALESCVDTMIVIPNQKLFEEQESHMTSLVDAFGQINDVMFDCIKGVVDTIYKPGHINIDFADIKSVMSHMGRAVIGIGRASGENRAQNAIVSAIQSPLLESTSLKGSRSILLNISGPSDLNLHEVNVIAGYAYDQAHIDANIIIGTSINDQHADEIIVTVVATGFEDQLKARSLRSSRDGMKMYSSNQSQYQDYSNNFHGFYKAGQVGSSAAQQSSHSNEEHGAYSPKAASLNEQSLETPALLRNMNAKQHSSQD